MAMQQPLHPDVSRGRKVHSSANAPSILGMRVIAMMAENENT
jgi:hypothetical protein